MSDTLPVLCKCVCGCYCSDSRVEPWCGKGPDVGPSPTMIGWTKDDLGEWWCPTCAGKKAALYEGILNGFVWVDWDTAHPPEGPAREGKT